MHRRIVSNRINNIGSILIQGLLILARGGGTGETDFRAGMIVSTSHRAVKWGGRIELQHCMVYFELRSEVLFVPGGTLREDGPWTCTV